MTDWLILNELISHVMSRVSGVRMQNGRERGHSEKNPGEENCPALLATNVMSKCGKGLLYISNRAMFSDIFLLFSR